MACGSTELSPWTCAGEVSSPGLRREDFFSALDVWVTRPQVATSRFLGAISLDVGTLEDVEVLACGFSREEIDSFVRDYWGKVGILCRRLIPKQKHYKPIEEFVITDKQTNSVTFLPLSSPIYPNRQFLTHSAYKIQFFTSDTEQEARIHLYCLTEDFITTPTSESTNQLLPTISWLTDTLLYKIVRWGEESIGSAGTYGTPTQQLISLEEYSHVYLTLKEKYAHEFIKIWPESTDPIKFVCEDIGIASYLIVLWRMERRESGSEKIQSFLDLGCGNGLLTHILNSEGHPGEGMDMRKRKIWSLYGASTHLEQNTFIPSEDAIFSSKPDWVIGNHSDELTPWIPFIASRSSYDMKYCVIPCCAYDFYVKFSKREGSLSLYRSYLNFVREVGEVCGFRVEQDILRIPSTKKVCQIGRVRTYRREESSQIDILRLKYLNSRPCPPIPPLPPKKAKLTQECESTIFQPRDLQAVRNCSKQPKELQMEVVSLVTSNLLARGVVCVGDEWNRGGKMCVREIAELLPREKLTKLKNEHGGLQTLLKNQHQIFSGEIVIKPHFPISAV